MSHSQHRVSSLFFWKVVNAGAKDAVVKNDPTSPEEMI